LVVYGKWPLGYEVRTFNLLNTTPIVVDGNTDGTTAVVTGLTSTAQLTPDMLVTGDGIADSSTIASVDSATQVTLNNDTTSPGTGTALTFTPTKGSWLAMGRLLSPTVTVEGLESGGTISIRVSNQPERVTSDGVTSANFPAWSDDGAIHATLGDITADSAGGMGGAFTFVRAEKTVFGDSPTSTIVYAQAQQAK
jgi:hypothetical protein